MLNSKAYWITPDNEILDIGLGTHIDMIIKDPDQFNLTKESIITTYQKYNELIGIEGKARYEIIMQYWLMVLFVPDYILINTGQLVLRNGIVEQKRH